MEKNTRISEHNLSFNIRELYRDLCPGVNPEVSIATPVPDLESDPEFVADYLKSKFVEQILGVMEKQGIRKTDLAQKLNKSPQYISKIINETANFTIESMAAISSALGMTLEIKMHSKEEAIPIEENVVLTYHVGDGDGFPMDRISSNSCPENHEEILLTSTQ